MTIGRHQCGVSIDRVSNEAFSDGSITDCDHIFFIHQKCFVLPPPIFYA